LQLVDTFLTFDIRSLPAQLNLLIRKVNLSHNELVEVGPNSFASQTVDLSFNKISLVREAAFKAESALNINLDSNLLTSNSIQHGFIRSFQKLGELSLNIFLNNNQIQYLDEDVFRDLLSSSATSISLDGNAIQCNCRVKWLLDAKRFDRAWATLYPRVEGAKCTDGNDLIKEYYNPDLSNCGK